MPPLEVAVVSIDPDARLAAARAFDAAPAAWRVSLHETVPSGADVVVLGPDVEGEGIRFSPSQPTRLIEDIERAIAPAARTFVITGAGRGVGCTSVALHLALEFARSWETCFVDFDRFCGAADRLAIDDRHLTWADVSTGSESLRLAALPVPGGFRVLLARRGESPPVKLLPRATKSFERVVVDCPHDSVTEDVLDIANAVVLVAPATTTGAKRVAQILGDHPDANWAVVTNRLGPGGEAMRSALSRIAGHRIVLELPCTPALRNAEQEGRLIATPWSRWKRAVARLAAALESV